MRFAWFVARRYLRSPYRPAVLRLVTLFSVIGVAAGVATLMLGGSAAASFLHEVGAVFLLAGALAVLILPRQGGEVTGHEGPAAIARPA